MPGLEARARQPTIPDPAGAGPALRYQPAPTGRTPHLLAYLATIPDPRAFAGRRHPLVAIFALAAAGVPGAVDHRDRGMGHRHPPADPGCAGRSPRLLTGA
jgi:hypothetical protein